MHSERTTDEQAVATHVCAACGFEHDPHACPAGRIGQLLGGRYRVLSVLGVGGMGAVYEARHEVVGRRFAVKVLQPEVLRRPSALTRFHREARAAGMLDSEHIAAVTDFGNTDDGVPFIVMEYLEGRDLSRVLAREGALTPGRAAELALQACRALVAAHARGIVHRDLKPENLFLCQRGDGSERVKLLDFGIAKLQSGAEDKATRTGVTLGTPYYMSPEQAQGQKELDHRTDIYSLGAVLYEMLTGLLAHPGSSPHEVLYHVTSRAPRPLSELRPDLPAQLVAVVERAMAPQAGDRYASAADMASALAPFAGRMTPPATGAPVRDSVSTDELLPPGLRAPRRWLLLGIAAVCLLLVGAVAWWQARGTAAEVSVPAAASAGDAVSEPSPPGPATDETLGHGASDEAAGVPKPGPPLDGAQRAAERHPASPDAASSTAAEREPARAKAKRVEGAARRERTRPRPERRREREATGGRTEPAEGGGDAPQPDAQDDALPTLRRSRI